jgi:DNA-binding transcriptional ArsR family regulator
MSADREAPFSYPGLERIFHERGRLAICTCLIAHPDGLSFSDLQAACDLTDGNLNRHVHALGDLGIVTTEKQRGAGSDFSPTSTNSNPSFATCTSAPRPRFRRESWRLRDATPRRHHHGR